MMSSTSSGVYLMYLSKILAKFKAEYLKTMFGFKQLVNKPSSNDNILCLLFEKQFVSGHNEILIVSFQNRTQFNIRNGITLLNFANFLNFFVETLKLKKQI